MTDTKQDSFPIAISTMTMYCIANPEAVMERPYCLVSHNGFPVEIALITKKENTVIEPYFKMRYAAERNDWSTALMDGIRPVGVMINDISFFIQCVILEDYDLFVTSKSQATSMNVGVVETWPDASKRLAKLMADNFKVVYFTPALGSGLSYHNDIKNKILAEMETLKYYSGDGLKYVRPEYSQLRDLGLNLLPSLYELLQSGHRGQMIFWLLKDLTGGVDPVPEAFKHNLKAKAIFWMKYLEHYYTKYIPRVDPDLLEAQISLLNKEVQ